MRGKGWLKIWKKKAIVLIVKKRRKKGWRSRGVTLMLFLYKMYVKVLTERDSKRKLR